MRLPNGNAWTKLVRSGAVTGLHLDRRGRLWRKRVRLSESYWTAKRVVMTAAEFAGEPVFHGSDLVVVGVDMARGKDWSP